MTRGNPNGTLAVLVLGLGWGFAIAAHAAETGTNRSAPTPSSTSRAAPAAPSTSATTARPVPAAPARTGKPDYAVALGSQQEFKNTALAWTFRIDNKGNAAPEGVSKYVPGTSTVVKSWEAATLVISVGQPCPETKYWEPLASIPVPVLQPGASVAVPQTLYKMPDEYAGKGCRFRAKLAGPTGDANASNNVMHMITKTAQQPDLVVGWGEVQGGPGGALEVKNIGSAPSGPSKFRYECQTTEPKSSCGLPTQGWKQNEVRDVPVPALKPGQSHVVKGSTPKGPGVSWKAYADHAHEVAESNESNNTMTGGK